MRGCKFCQIIGESRLRENEIIRILVTDQNVPAHFKQVENVETYRRVFPFAFTDDPPIICLAEKIHFFIPLLKRIRKINMTYGLNQHA